MSAPSRMLRRGVLLGTAGAVLAGCGGGTPPTPPPAAVAPAPAPVVRPKEPDTGKALPPIAYEPKGRRDPFTPIFLGKDNAALSVSAVKLTGVVGGPSSLLALVEAPDGIGYILKPGDALGDGRVTGITPNSVTFAVSARGSQSASSLTLRLPENQ
jgi:type IV pilus assembly protein PilP